MTLEETADFISEGLPGWQRNSNLEFLNTIHSALKENGVWCYPDARMLFKKTPDGFELIE